MTGDMSLIKSSAFQLLNNPRIDRSSAYEGEGRANILNHTAFELAKQEISSWPGYHETPLRKLPKLARVLGVRQILYKDEGERFGLGSSRLSAGLLLFFVFFSRNSNDK